MRDDGGPAFPQGKGTGYFGMSLRDWFAGQVVPRHIVSVDPDDCECLIAAQTAYRIADAMLRARK